MADYFIVKLSNPYIELTLIIQIIKTVKKRLFLSAIVILVVGLAFAAFNSNTNHHEFTDLELANIAALTDGEATLLDDCYENGYGTSDWGEFYECNEGTTEYKLYSCSNKQIRSKGDKKKCVLN